MNAGKRKFVTILSFCNHHLGIYETTFLRALRIIMKSVDFYCKWLGSRNVYNGEKFHVCKRELYSPIWEHC